MTGAKLIILNTVVQYVRTFVSMIIMLFSTRILLDSFGQSGYGLYSVVGSMVFMIGFITVSLASSTQRFLSFSHGKEDKVELREIFANAFCLHVLIALVIACVMYGLSGVFLSNLDVTDDQRSSAMFMYFMVLLMVLLTFITAPLRALYIARENILYVSVVEILDAFLKLGGAVMLGFISYDPLKVYSLVMFGVSVFNFLAYALYARIHYEECHVPSFREISKDRMKGLMGFAVWNVYAVGSGVARTQGLAIVINRFLGTLVNAAYGIALQVYNAVSFIALSILNSVNPQLMKAEGAGDRQRMLLLSTKESKYSFLVLVLLLTPLVFEMPMVLSFWLREVPEHAVMFCQFILIAYIWDQTTIGLTSANQAIGRIRNYSLLTSTIRLMVLPVAWFCLKSGLPPVSVMLSYVAIDVLIGFIRIPFLKATAGLDVWNYVKDVYVRCALPALSVVAVSWSVGHYLDFPFRFVFTEIVAVVVGIVMVYLVALDSSERAWIVSKLNKKRRKS